MSFITFPERTCRPIAKTAIEVLQINLGRRCNLACNHCHVEASPKRTEELSPEICCQLVEIIEKFDNIKTVDLTGGAPEMNYGFRPLLEAAKKKNKEVIVRSNLTIYFVDDYTDLPEYCARYRVRIVASLPCYLEDNVDRMRGAGVYKDSIAALQILNHLGYGQNPELQLDLVYNPGLPKNNNFSLPPAQSGLQEAYKTYLREKFDIEFNNLLTIANLPIGRTRQRLENLNLAESYLEFLADRYNPQTLPGLMCKNQLSIDYLGNIYDCDFNQMAAVAATDDRGNPLTVADLLAANTLDLISSVKTADYCYGCTAGSGSSCGGALL
jgi:radical SAM/Cys-rich protein